MDTPCPVDTDSPSTSPEKSVHDILDSFDKKLTSLDGRLALVEVLHQEFRALRESLEPTREQVTSLAAENQTLREKVEQLAEGMTPLSGENKNLREPSLDHQARGLRVDLVFSGIPERAGQDPEASVRECVLHLLSEAVKNVTSRRGERLGGKKPENKQPRRIVAHLSIKTRSKIQVHTAWYGFHQLCHLAL